MTGKIVSINVSDRKGVQKSPVSAAILREGHGVVGDVHAGPGEKQVSLLAFESIEAQKKLFEEKAAGLPGGSQGGGAGWRPRPFDFRSGPP